MSTSKCNAKNPETEDYPLDFIHPVLLLERLLDRAIDPLLAILAVLRPQHAPSHPRVVAVRKHRKKSKPEFGRDDFRNATRSLEHVSESACDCGCWLRWGMGERAGTFETDLQRALDELLGCLRCIASTENDQDLGNHWYEHVSKLLDLNGELQSTAIDLKDTAESEWYRILQVMRTRLADTLGGIEEMRAALGELPSGKKAHFRTPSAHSGSRV